MADMASMERLLPSLLDRLTNNDPLNRSLHQQKIHLNQITEQLTVLDDANDYLETDQQCQQINLQKQLKQAHAKYQKLSASISSLQDIRECVKRDLDWLLNAHYFMPQAELENYPEVRRSVLNYGLPDLIGYRKGRQDTPRIERMLKTAIQMFEPRIMPSTLKVSVLENDSSINNDTLYFEIKGELWAEPIPIQLYLRTELELGNSTMSITEFNT